MQILYDKYFVRFCKSFSHIISSYSGRHIKLTLLDCLLRVSTNWVIVEKDDEGSKRE